jgi:hypothetical protein
MTEKISHMAHNTHETKKMENDLQAVAVKAFRQQHPVNEIGADHFEHKKAVYKRLVEKTDKKYRKIARKQKQKRDLEKTIRRSRLRLPVQESRRGNPGSGPRRRSLEQVPILH